MICNKIYQKSTLDAVSTIPQILTENAPIEFAINRVESGASIRHDAGSSIIELKNAGLYLISFNADIVPTAAGVSTVQLFRNDVAVNGAKTTFTGVATTATNVTFSAILEVLPSCAVVDNKAVLQVVPDFASTVNTASIVIVKVA